MSPALATKWSQPAWVGAALVALALADALTGATMVGAMALVLGFVLGCRWLASGPQVGPWDLWKWMAAAVTLALLWGGWRQGADAMWLQRLLLAAVVWGIGANSRPGSRELRSGAVELQVITDSLPSLIGFVDDSQTYRFVNAAYERHYGIPRERIIGQTVRQLNGDAAYEGSRQYIETALSGQPVEFAFSTATDGDLRHYIINYIPYRSPHVSGYFVLTADVTPMKQVEEQLRVREEELRKTLKKFDDLTQFAHQDRLATMGEMASGLAHELNQPLTVIANNAYLLGVGLEDSPIDLAAITQLANLISDQAVAAGEVVHRMREFVSDKQRDYRPCDLNEAVRDAVKITETTLRHAHISLHLELANDLRQARVDPVQIQQVLVNLIVNSAEAIVETAAPRREITVETCQHAESLEIIVSDSGPGISEAVMETLFDPFQSTKREGMGMGLAISRSIIERHGGQLEGKNREVGGATFRVTLQTLA